MQPPAPLRILLTCIAAIVGFGLAFMLGAGGEPAALTGAIAALGAWFAWHAHAPEPSVEPAGDETPQPSLDEVMEAIDDPMLLVSGQIVTVANAAARAVLGDHIIGEDVRLAIRHPAATDRLTLRRTADDGADDAPIELVGIGDRERRWELVVHPIWGRGLLVRLADRTGTHAAEKMRVDFVANASHELRTPLATLLGFIETLEDGKAAENPATRGRFLKIMFGEAKRMQRLVDDLMSLSRIEAEKYSVPQTPVALAPLIEDVRGAFHNGIVENGDRVVVDIAADVPPISGDKVQISQLLHNLIGNALKYGRPGSPVRVTVKPASGNMVKLCVRDEGEGIPAEHIPRLTERFYRVDPGRSRSLGGTGLGLAIVKHIVERHRGRLEIRSEVGRGTLVSVFLPAAIAPQMGALSSKSHANVTEGTPNRTSAHIDPA
nr:ATP-binding protein [Sphingomonas laterariae]